METGNSAGKMFLFPTTKQSSRLYSISEKMLRRYSRKDELQSDDISTSKVTISKY